MMMMRRRKRDLLFPGPHASRDFNGERMGEKDGTENAVYNQFDPLCLSLCDSSNDARVPELEAQAHVTTGPALPVCLPPHPSLSDHQLHPNHGMIS